MICSSRSTKHASQLVNKAKYTNVLIFDNPFNICISISRGITWEAVERQNPNNLRSPPSDNPFLLIEG